MFGSTRRPRKSMLLVELPDIPCEHTTIIRHRDGTDGSYCANCGKRMDEEDEKHA